MNPLALFQHRLRAIAANLLLLTPAVMLVVLYVLGSVQPWGGD